MDEELADVKERLGRMEAVLNQAVGFRITTSYGTDLIVELRPFHTRRWVSIAGVVDKPGVWDNPGAEIFTTPDEIEVDGVLKLAVLDTEIDTVQGVDEWIELVFYDGVVREIRGGESARKLREKLAEDAKYEESKRRDPLNVYRIAEIGFGASKGIPLVTDVAKDYTFPGIATVLAEKCFGSIHLALGGSDHGEEGTEGHFTKVQTHYDFVISGAGGLTVEMFTSEEGMRKGINSRKIISSGGMPEW